VANSALRDIQKHPELICFGWNTTHQENRARQAAAGILKNCVWCGDTTTEKNEEGEAHCIPCKRDQEEE